MSSKNWAGWVILLVSAAALSAGHTDYLAQTADAVVVAEVQGGQHKDYALSFVLRIVRVLKGAAQPGLTINVTGRARTSSSHSLPSHYGLWFLKRSVDSWTLLPVLGSNVLSLEASGVFPLSKVNSPQTLSDAPRAALGDQIAAEIAAGLQNVSDPNQLYLLAQGLEGLDETPFLKNLYRSLSKGSDPELRFIGFTGLLGTDEDALALTEIASHISLLRQLHTKSLVISAVCGNRNSAPEAIQALASMASSPDADLQRCVAVALDSIHTKATLPGLAQLLDSDDPRTKEYAMQGLSRFVDNLPIPTPDNVLSLRILTAQGPTPFRTSETDKYSLSRGWLGGANEIEYLQFWKSWWLAMKDTLMSTA